MEKCGRRCVQTDKLAFSPRISRTLFLQQNNERYSRGSSLPKSCAICPAVGGGERLSPKGGDCLLSCVDRLQLLISVSKAILHVLRGIFIIYLHTVQLRITSFY